MSHKLFRSILLACLFACALLFFPAFAQAGAAPEPASPATNNVDALTPDQARRALDTLQDDKKRAQIIDTLRAIANASPQAQAASAAPEQQAAIPLTADSLGAQLLLTVSEQVSEVSHQVADMARTLTHFPAFYYWIVRTANDPSAYDQLLEIAWKLALVFGCAFAAEWLILRVIQRPVALLEARLPQTACAQTLYVPERTPAVIDPPASAAEVTAEPELHQRRRSLARVWQSLLRLPFVLGRLLLELLPVLVFVGVAMMLLGTGIGDLATTRLVILAVVNAYALSRGLICVVRALAGPFGLFRVRAETAAYIEIWTRRIVTVGVSGIAFANVALLLGLHRAGYLALLRLVMLVVHLFIVIIILQCRRQVAEAIRAPAGREGTAARLRNRYRRPVALSCDCSGPGTMGGVGAQYPQRLLAAAAIFCRNRCGRTDHPYRHHRGAQPDRSRFSHQPGYPAAFPRPRSPRQSLSAATAQNSFGDHRFHRLCCAA